MEGLGGERGRVRKERVGMGGRKEPLGKKGR